MTDQTAGAADAAPKEADPKQIRKAVAGSAMGNCIEWYDFGVFGFMPAILGQVFFNASSTSEGALATFALLAVTFVIRPLGSFVLGPLGDKLGRQKVLALTVILMSGSTFVIGLLPSWETIGPAAAVLVILLRSLQGFSAGGEYGGAATFIAEYAPDRKRGFLGSWLEFGTLVGFFLGAGTVTLATVLLGNEAMADWGWRIPFLLAGPLGLVGLYLRNKLEDTPVFQEIEKTKQVSKSPLKELFSKHWRSILHLIGLVILLNVGDWMMFGYIETYLKDVLELEGHAPLLIVMSVILGMLVLIVPLGALSDRIGRKPILITCCAGFLVLPIPMFTLMENSKTETGVNVLMLGSGLALFGLCLVLFLSVVASTLPAMFPTQVRYGAFSIGYNTSTALFAGTAPFVVGSLVDATGNTLWPAFYLMAAAAIAAIPILLLPETAGVSLRGIVSSRIARRGHGHRTASAN
ncbi:MFS transporter [Amycolatopsis magusensis]|uniref:MHS family proline/betaine transporter-like MFS transporter n=1 Tax=Amycolatopsis magusensis TaxID=882444 RepID=A0ABS4PL67_9PSEU|nr:MFS transporter [Amycolatopsis magusensis]MBP2180164.1 MHS family proline/betaine transporter-like MFS transporter [Amycolatopsis magusensis]